MIIMANNYRVPEKILIAGLILFQFSCTKQWLDAKPTLSLVVPTTVADYQALLDNTTDNGFNVNQNSLVEIASGDFYLSDNTWSSVSPIERNCYIWASNLYDNGANNYTEWLTPYKKVFTSNVALDGLAKITPSGPSDQQAWNTAMANALFLRAYSFYDVAQSYCKVY